MKTGGVMDWLTSGPEPFESVCDRLCRAVARGMKMDKADSARLWAARATAVPGRRFDWSAAVARHYADYAEEETAKGNPMPKLPGRTYKTPCLIECMRRGIGTDALFSVCVLEQGISPEKGVREVRAYLPSLRKEELERLVSVVCFKVRIWRLRAARQIIDRHSKNERTKHHGKSR